MSIEYRLRYSGADVPTVAQLLRQIPTAREITAVHFDLGCDPNDIESVEASVYVQSGESLFSDHCGPWGRALLGVIVAKLASAVGPVTVEEMEHEG